MAHFLRNTGRRMSRNGQKLDRSAAESIALSALTFLAEDSVRLGRFLALTGMGPDDLRESAGSAGTLCAVLDYLLGDESLLLVFTASKGVPPQDLAPARALLAASTTEIETP
jgi:hypothetical protein